MHKLLILTLLTPLIIHAQMIISPYKVMQAEFGEKATITKANKLLNAAQAKEVQTLAKVKLTTKIYRTFIAEVNNTRVGYAILVAEKVRTKKAAMLYVFTPKGEMLSSNVIAFNEPHEFIPSEKWLSQFKNTTPKNRLQVGKDIPTITGATMSARCVADSARIARAVFEVLYTR